MAHLESALPTNKLQGKVAIITGGASGIGEATAHVFANHGAKAIVIVDVQDEKGQAVVNAIGPDRCTYVRCDVSDEEQVKSMVDFTVQKYGQLDIMFSNAGIASKSEQKLLELDLAEYDRLFKVNARGMAICVKHAARVMVEKGVKGNIVCTSSAVADNWRGAMTMTDYIMAKNAVLGLVRTASQQLGRYGIRANSVSPAAIATPITMGTGLTSSEMVEQVFGPFTPLKGISLTVQHVADVVLFLVSDQSAFVTGHDIVVDGGLISIPHNIFDV